MNLEQVHKVHLLGIGGIGMSALARYLHLLGKQVTGYDRTSTPMTDELIAEGIPVHFQADLASLDGVDLIVYTPAVPKAFAEFEESVKRGLPMVKRAELLGMISRQFRAIAVAGTHGKTSTSGLTTHLLRSCGIDCTAFVGGIMKNYNTNFLFGKSDWVVVEADEFDRSFLRLSPELAVITSMDADHLDIYGTGASLEEAFVQFANKVNPQGRVFYNARLEKLTSGFPAVKTAYGIESGACRAENVRHGGLHTIFDYVSPKGTIRDLRINLPGTYNVENATAAISVALEAGGDEAGIRKGIETFSGIRRRFDIQHTSADLAYIDDYAHHPEEIRALMTAVRETLPGKKVIAAFQPHLFSRTNDFYPGFAESLSMADAVILLDIYPAREEPMPGVTSALIFDKLTAVEKEQCTLSAFPGVLEKYRHKPAVVLTVGAGDIDTQVKTVKKMVEAWT